MSLLLLLCEHRQVPQMEDFFPNFPLNFSPPQPRVSNHERRMEKRMDGVRTRAVCISGINPPRLVSFPWLSFVGEVSVTAAALNVSGPQGALRALIKWRHVAV